LHLYASKEDIDASVQRQDAFWCIRFVTFAASCVFL